MSTRVGIRAAATAVATLFCIGTSPAEGDISGFVGFVGFDDSANLDSSPGFGVRWGRSGATFGGETSLMISRPSRDLADVDESATAIFYEGRFLLNIPAGQIRPFVGVGFGAITVTSTDVPDVQDADASAALKSVSDLQTNQAFSYGGGVRYRLAERLDLRVDVRQYQVFSVAGAVIAKATEELAEATGADLTSEENRVQYNELSVGVVVNF